MFQKTKNFPQIEFLSSFGPERIAFNRHHRTVFPSNGLVIVRGTKLERPSCVEATTTFWFSLIRCVPGCMVLPTYGAGCVYWACLGSLCPDTYARWEERGSRFPSARTDSSRRRNAVPSFRSSWHVLEGPAEYNERDSTSAEVNVHLLSEKKPGILGIGRACMVSFGVGFANSQTSASAC